MTFWTDGTRRREFIYTIAWDTLVVATAMIGRAGLLWLESRFAAALQADWGIRALEWVASRAMVGLAITFALFDLLKRVVREGQDLWAVLTRPRGQWRDHE